MANFMIRFLLCNVLISGIVGILLIAKWVFRNNLSSRMQYNLWLLLLGLLAVPFIPFRLISFPQIFSWLSSVRNSSASSVFPLHPEIPIEKPILITRKPLFKNLTIFFDNITASTSSFYVFYHADNHNRTLHILVRCKNRKPSQFSPRCIIF